MKKKLRLLLGGVLYLFSMGVIAASCPVASAVSSPEFCNSFKIAAECHCISSGLPRGMCTNQTLLYKRMIDTFGSLKRACEFQRDASVQECIDDWNCYLSGGVTSDLQSCSGNGNPCV